MSQKGIYKKANGPGWDYDPDNKRAKENKFFELTASDKVATRKKSEKKGKPRSDHKHDYESVYVWRKGYYTERLYGAVAQRCAICGKVETSYHFRAYRQEQKYLGELKHFFEVENTIMPIPNTEYQKTVYLSGSKTVNVLTVDVKNKIIDMMHRNYRFIIGDFEGASIQMQKLLYECGYQNVVVYYKGDYPLVNLGGWKGKHLPYNCKEQALLDCNEGFMVMDREEEWWRTDLQKLIANQKACEVCIYQKGMAEPISAAIWRICNEKDLGWLVESCKQWI